MTTKRLTHKGYIGDLDIDLDTGMLVGEIVNVPNVILFEGKSVDEARQKFEESVEGHIAWCQEEGAHEEGRPYPGRILLRTSPDKHRLIARAVRLAGAKSTNAWIEATLTAAAERTIAASEGREEKGSSLKPEFFQGPGVAFGSGTMIHGVEGLVSPVGPFSRSQPHIMFLLDGDEVVRVLGTSLTGPGQWEVDRGKRGSLRPQTRHVKLRVAEVEAAVDEPHLQTVE